MVCLVTSSGFKDVVSVERMLKEASCPTLELADLERRVEQESRRLNGLPAHRRRARRHCPRIDHLPNGTKEISEA